MKLKLAVALLLAVIFTIGLQFDAWDDQEIRRPTPTTTTTTQGE